MRTGKFCFNCGGDLVYLSGELECSSCSAVYSNVLISESEFTQDGFEVLEIGLCTDIAIRTPVVILDQEVRELTISSIVKSTSTPLPEEAVA